MSSVRVIIVLALIAPAFPVLAGVPDPESIRVTLTKGTDSAVNSLAKSLGMTEWDWAKGAKSDYPCEGFDTVSIDKVLLFGPRAQVIVTAHAPSMCEMTYVAILNETSKGKWQVVDTIGFLEHHVTPVISFEKLITPKYSEIVVRNNEVDYGTGIENIRMTIFSVSASGARIIFDEPIELTWAIPSVSAKDGNTEQSESDEYAFMDDSGDNGKKTGIKFIRRTETIKDHDATITRWWNYRWDPLYTKLTGFQYTEGK